MPLTDKSIRAAAPKEKRYTLFDTNGLLLIVSPSGGKWWRQRYSFDGKRKHTSLGTYPKVTLKHAREKCFSNHLLIERGIDPAAKEASTGITFFKVAEEYLDKHTAGWSEVHDTRERRGLNNNVYPWIGEKPLRDITPKDMLDVIRRIEDRGVVETAHRVLRRCGAIFRYGVACQYCNDDPTRNLADALPVARVTHLAAITAPREVGALLNAIDGYTGNYIVCSALRAAPYLFVRPGELRHAEWTEFDLDALMADDECDWEIPAGKMKMREPHIVPLASQVRAILRELHPFSGRGKYLFASVRTPDRPMSNNTMNAALRRMGYSKEDMTAHGFRAMARTLIDEQLKVRPDFIEHQLAHAVRDPLGRAYNRTKHLDERRYMMQQWADYLDELKAAARTPKRV